MAEYTSWACLEWVRGLRGITSIERLVLYSLASRADQNASCFPSQQVIAEENEVSTRTVVRALVSLEKKGLVQHERRDAYGTKRMSNRYYLGIGEKPIYLGDKSGTGPTDLDDKSGYLGDKSGYLGDMDVTLEHSLEHSLEHQDIYSADSVDDALEQAFETVWKAWPKKADRKDAWQKFRTTTRKYFPSRIGLDQLVGFMLDHAEAYRKYRPDPIYVPSVASWLNKQRWNDPPITAPQGHLRPVPIQQLELTDRERELFRAKAKR